MGKSVNLRARKGCGRVKIKSQISIIPFPPKSWATKALTPRATRTPRPVVPTGTAAGRSHIKTQTVRPANKCVVLFITPSAYHHCLSIDAETNPASFFPRFQAHTTTPTTTGVPTTTMGVVIAATLHRLAMFLNSTTEMISSETKFNFSAAFSLANYIV